MPASEAISNNRGNRSLSIDLIKIIAMIFVVGLHTTHGFSSGGAWTVGAIIYRTGDIAIPLFFMVSGYLLLGRDTNRANYRYSLRKIFGILRFVVTVGIIYGVAKWVSGAQPFNGEGAIATAKTIALAIKNTIFQRGDLWMLWYLGSMIIIYSVYPVLNKVFLHHTVLFKAILSGLCALAILFFMANVLRFPFGVPLEAAFYQTFRLWDWLFYFCMGGMMHKLRFTKVSGYCLLALILTLAFVNLLQQAILMPKIQATVCEYFYGSPLTMAFVIVLFYIIKSLNIRHGRVISMLSTVFLPVYVIHVFVINSLYDTSIFESILSTGDIIAPLIVWIGVSAISVAVSLVLMRIPYISQLIKI